MPSKPQTPKSFAKMKLNHPLDGIAAKIERANESIQNLNAEINEFLTRAPRPYHIESGFYDDPRKYVFRAYSQAPIPLRFSVLAGEIVHQFRSCFDHLIVALAEVNGTPRNRNHQFPICRKREKFRKACEGGQIQGITKPALRRVIAAQPYRDAAPDDTTILAIHQLDVRDKHSLLLIVEQTARIGAEIRVGADSSGVIIAGMSPPKPHVISEHGVEVFSIDLATPVADFHADADFDTQIALADVGGVQVVPAIPLLNRMSSFTSNIIYTFVDLF